MLPLCLSQAQGEAVPERHFEQRLLQGSGTGNDYSHELAKSCSTQT